MVANQGTAASHVTCLLICYWSGEGRVPVHQVAPPGVRRLLAAPLSQGAGQEGGGQAGHTQPVQYLHTFYRASTNFLYTIYIFYKLTTQYLHSIHIHEVTVSLTLYLQVSWGSTSSLANNDSATQVTCPASYLYLTLSHQQL